MSTAVTLGMTFNNNIMSTSFNDGTIFKWNPISDPSTVSWQQYYGTSPTSLPQSYLDVVVMPDASQWTLIWFPSLPSYTIPLPSGPLTLGGLMQAIYGSIGQNMTADDYQSTVGNEWTGSVPPTVEDTVIGIGSVDQDTPQLGSLAMYGDGKTIFLRVY